ncbi:MAG TPA: hypothetical protein VI386_23505 [Candidatus Sulfotelmatobacter sp.]
MVILYLGTYEARVSDVYRTLRHKVIALAHFRRFIRDKHPSVKALLRDSSTARPRPHPARARTVQRGPGADEEVRPTAHSWLVDLRVFFSDVCAWATEPHSPFNRFASEHLNNNMPVHVIQALLGHASPDTVMIYAKDSSALAVRMPSRRNMRCLSFGAC